MPNPSILSGLRSAGNTLKREGPLEQYYSPLGDLANRTRFVGPQQQEPLAAPSIPQDAPPQRGPSADSLLAEAQSTLDQPTPWEQEAESPALNYGPKQDTPNAYSALQGASGIGAGPREQTLAMVNDPANWKRGEVAPPFGRLGGAIGTANKLRPMLGKFAGRILKPAQKAAAPAMTGLKNAVKAPLPSGELQLLDDAGRLLATEASNPAYESYQATRALSGNTYPAQQSAIKDIPEAAWKAFQRYVGKPW